MIINFKILLRKFHEKKKKILSRPLILSNKVSISK